MSPGLEGATGHPPLDAAAAWAEHARRPSPARGRLGWPETDVGEGDALRAGRRGGANPNAPQGHRGLEAAGKP